MHGIACAFCQDGLNHWKHESEVEHFRPKKRVAEAPDHGGYWWLAYDFRNMFLSCSHCNKHFKQDHFPLDDGSTRAHFSDYGKEDQQSLLAGQAVPPALHPDNKESRLSLEPVLDPVDGWLSLDPTSPLWPVCLTGEFKNNAVAAARLAMTNEILRLNVRPELISKRGEIYEDIRRWIDLEDWEAVRERAYAHLPHAWTVRQIWRALDVDSYHNHCPKATDDWDACLDWFANQILKAIIVEEYCGSQPGFKKAVTRFTHALAVMWLCPLDGNPTRVEERLSEHTILEEVRPTYEALRVG
ncbi:MAG: hypothetical protein QNK37_21960 [Acidobacteriota bacterium]|nr:hypothetical protein [Acidobacteriota bacterium]